MPKLATPPAEGYKSQDNWLGQLRPYVVECLRRLGKDPYLCELCGKKFDRKLTIHHKKYDGATIYDLCYACHSCQNRKENVGLS